MNNLVKLGIIEVCNIEGDIGFIFQKKQRVLEYHFKWWKGMLNK